MGSSLLVVVVVVVAVLRNRPMVVQASAQVAADLLRSSLQ
jgi:hypothetical protein